MKKKKNMMVSMVRKVVIESVSNHVVICIIHLKTLSTMKEKVPRPMSTRTRRFALLFKDRDGSKDLQYLLNDLEDRAKGRARRGHGRTGQGDDGDAHALSIMSYADARMSDDMIYSKPCRWCKRQ